MKVSRRAFLRANGAAMSLPFLASVAGAKSAATVNKKFVMMYVPNGLVRRGFFPGEQEAELPGFKGGFSADGVKDKRKENVPGTYPLELTPTMQPLAAHAKDITLVTGMDRTFKNGQDVHAQAASCYLTSISPEQAAAKGMRHPNGRSLDQIIADKVGQHTVLPSLEISCNGFRAGKEDIYFNNISWYGENRIAPSIKEPRKLYERLFMAGNYRKHVTEVTDLVLADAKALSGKLNHDDRQTMDEFMTMIRDIELRIERLEKVAARATVKEPTDEILPRKDYIRLQADLLIAALQMGITNISTFMIGPERWEATLLYEDLFDKPVNHHQFTHNQKGDSWHNAHKIDVFHMEQYDYMMSRMKSIPEADGSTMFDNAIVTYGAGMGDGATHQYFDMPFVVGGGAQGQIKQGRFIQCKSGTLNSNMWLSLAQLMGLELDSFADSNGVISDLWT
ncbi:MAG: hypothetical protein ACI8W8_002476 [Rhodothermales bacterium]|jgi:hypothetical protein